MEGDIDVDHPIMRLDPHPKMFERSASKLEGVRCGTIGDQVDGFIVAPKGGEKPESQRARFLEEGPVMQGAARIGNR